MNSLQKIQSLITVCKKQNNSITTVLMETIVALSKNKRKSKLNLTLKLEMSWLNFY